MTFTTSISIHSSHTGRDTRFFRSVFRQYGFQSTLPIRGETAHWPRAPVFPDDFNPLFPYGERLQPVGGLVFDDSISIHSSHTGRDHAAGMNDDFQILFQSTLPIRGETPQPFFVGQVVRHFNPLFPYGERPRRHAGKGFYLRISIHSPHTGRDPDPKGEGRAKVDISIHSPHTGRDGGSCW